MPILPGVPPVFVVPDLSQDERFCNYPTAKAAYRFYAGTPLRTRRGVSVGSLCVLDHRPRDGLPEEQQDFMVTIANIIMDYLEMRREAQERRKVSRMAQGLNAFVEGRSSIDMGGGPGREPTWFTQASSNSKDPNSKSDSKSTWESREGRAPTTTVDFGQSKPSASSASISSSGDSSRLGTASTQSTSAPQRSSTDASEVEGQQAHGDGDYYHTFARAARLLGESLDLGKSGTVVFYDTTQGVSTLQCITSDSN
jgi:hypothetical protein